MEESKREQKPRIRIVDSREPEELRMKLIETGWEQKQLYSADFWFFSHDYKKVGIERKEIGDFIQSLGDRLSNQLERMLEHYDYTILLLEGNWRQVINNGHLVTGRGVVYNTWSMAWNYIRAQQHKGVTIELTTGLGHTITRLNELYAWYQKSFHSGGMSKNTFSDDRVMAFPSGCRGKTAEKVLDVFKSLVAVGNASAEDLLHVDGIGEKKAIAIYNHFNKGVNEIPIEQYKEVEEECMAEEVQRRLI